MNAKINHLGSNTCSAPKFFHPGLKDIIKYSKIDPDFKKTPYYRVAVEGLKQNSLLRKIFSVTNSADRKHKIVQILGFKFSFKK